MDESSGAGPSGPLRGTPEHKNVNEFLDTSGWSLFYLQPKYFSNWQQLGIHHRGIKKNKAKQKLRIRLLT